MGEENAVKEGAFDDFLASRCLRVPDSLEEGIQLLGWGDLSDVKHGTSVRVELLLSIPRDKVGQRRKLVFVPNYGKLEGSIKAVDEVESEVVDGEVAVAVGVRGVDFPLFVLEHHLHRHQKVFLVKIVALKVALDVLGSVHARRLQRLSEEFIEFRCEFREELRSFVGGDEVVLHYGKDVHVSVDLLHAREGFEALLLLGRGQVKGVKADDLRPDAPVAAVDVGVGPNAPQPTEVLSHRELPVRRQSSVFVEDAQKDQSFGDAFEVVPQTRIALRPFLQRLHSGFHGRGGVLRNVGFEVGPVDDCNLEAAVLREVNVVLVAELGQITKTFFLENPQLFGDIEDVFLTDVNLKVFVEFGLRRFGLLIGLYRLRRSLNLVRLLRYFGGLLFENIDFEVDCVDLRQKIILSISEGLQLGVDLFLERLSAALGFFASLHCLPKREVKLVVGENNNE